jgi:hypothetical protein
MKILSSSKQVGEQYRVENQGLGDNMKKSCLVMKHGLRVNLKNVL